MAKNLIFGYLDHSKWHFLWILNDPPWAIPWPTHAHHLVLAKYAISSRSEVRNAIKTREIGRNPYGSFKRAETRRRVARKTFLKKNQILPGQAVFAVILPEHCSFIQKFFQKIAAHGFSSKSDQSQKRAIFGTFS